MEIAVKNMTRNIKPFLRYYRKAIIMISVMLLTVLAISIASDITHKSVESRQGIVEGTMAVVTKTGKDAHPVVYEMFYGERGLIRMSLSSMFDPEKYRAVSEKLAVRPTDSGGVKIAKDITVPGGLMNSINNSLISIGFFLALVTFGYNLFNSMMRNGGTNPMTLVSLFIHLIIVLALVVNGRNLSLFAVNLGSDLSEKVCNVQGEDFKANIDDMVKQLSDATLGSVIDKDSIIELLDDEADARAEKAKDDGKSKNIIYKISQFLLKGLGYIWNSTIGYLLYTINDGLVAIETCMGIYLSMFIPWLAVKCANIVIDVLIYSRSLEILVLAQMAPIAFGFMSESGLGSSTGMRYLKNMMALALQGVVVVVILSMTSSIIVGYMTNYSAADMTGGMKLTTNLVIMSWVEVGMIKKSLGICQKVVGLS